MLIGTLDELGFPILEFDGPLGTVANEGECKMRNVFYIIGVVVVVIVLLRFLGVA